MWRGMRVVSVCQYFVPRTLGPALNCKSESGYGWDERTYSSSKLLVIMRTSYQYLILLSSSLIGFILLRNFMTI